MKFKKNHLQKLQLLLIAMFFSFFVYGDNVFADTQTWAVPGTYTFDTAGKTITNITIKGAGGGGEDGAYGPFGGVGSQGEGISANLNYNGVLTIVVGQGGGGYNPGGTGYHYGADSGESCDEYDDCWAGGGGGGSSAILTSGSILLMEAAGGNGGWGAIGGQYSASPRSYSNSTYVSGANAITGAAGGGPMESGANGSVVITYSLGAVNGVCGTANGQNNLSSVPSGAGLCSSGTSTPTFTPGSNPTPISWTCNGSNGGTNSPTCNASVNTYSITTSAGSNGSVTASSQVFSGSNFTVTATPDIVNHYHVASLTVDAINQGAVSNYTFSNISANHTVSATFALDQFTESFTVGTAGGTLSGPTSQIINYGGSTTAVTAVPNANYHFVNWTGVNGFATTTSNPLTISNVQANYAPTANFAADADSTKPAITAFVVPSTSSSLTIPITTFTASDNLGVTGYLVNESSTAPAASAITSASAPTTYTVASAGAKTLYAWVKDAAGNVSNAYAGQSCTVTLDTTKPTVTAFAVPSTTNSFDIPISTFTASDNIGVTGYLVNESSTAPTASVITSASAPTTYTVASSGAKTLYAWVKDAAGNVSNAYAGQNVTVTGPVLSGTYDSAVKNFTDANGVIPSPAYANINWKSDYIGSSALYDSQFPLGTANSRGINVDSAGNIYVAMGQDNVVKKFSPSGTLTKTFTGLSFPFAVAVDSVGNVFVADMNNNRVAKFDANGNSLPAIGAGMFYSPRGVALDSANNLYVADYNHSLIQKFDSSGNFIKSWSSSYASSIAIDSSDIVYVVDDYHDTVNKYDTLGNSLGQFIYLAGVSKVAVDNSGYVYLGASQYNSSATLIRQIGSGTGSGNGQFNSLFGLAVDSNGNIYVDDGGNSRVQIFKSGTSVNVQIRTGKNPSTTDSSWPAWNTCPTVTNGADISANPCVANGNGSSGYSYYQFRVTLNTLTGTNVPTVSNVTVTTQKTYPSNLTDSFLISSPFNTNNQYNKLTNLSWSAQQNGGAALNAGQIGFQVKTADTVANLATAQWCGPNPANCGTSGSFASDFYDANPSGTAITGAAATQTAGQPNNNKVFQYAAFLKGTSTTDAPVLKGVTMGYSFNIPPTVSVPYNVQQLSDGSITLKYDINGNIGNDGTQLVQNNPYVLLAWQPAAGITVKTDPGTNGTTIVINKPTATTPIPSKGQLLIDNELIDFNGKTEDATSATLTVKNGVSGRGFSFNGGASYKTIASLHTVGTAVFFIAKNVTGAVGLITPLNIDGTKTIGNLITWNPKLAASEENADYYGKTFANSITYKVVANDSDIFNPLNAANPLAAQSLDLQAPTISSITTTTVAGAYNKTATIPVTINFSENITTTGSVTITLNSGTCTISSPVTNQNTATCSYAVGTNDQTPQGQNLKVTSVSGIINDQKGNQQIDFNIPAALNLDVNSTKAIIIDNTAPTVGAGSDVNAKAQFNQTAVVGDDNSGSDSATYAWSKVSGPGTITFDSVNQLTTSITANQEGTYVIQFLAKDKAGNQTISTFNLIWDTTAPTFDNLSDKAANAQFTQTLANVTETGSGIDTYAWTKKTGTGNISFGSPDGNSTTILADTDGNYEIQIVVTDKAGNSTTKTMNLAWDSNAPTFDNIQDKAANGQFTQNLTNLTDGTGSGIDSYVWTKKSGEGNINFGTPNAESTNIFADADGSYVIQIDVKDKAGNIATKTMNLTWDTQAPQLDDLSSKTTNAEFTQVLGNVTDGTGSGVGTIAWSKVSGPTGGTINFGASDQTSTTIFASKDGNYLIQVVVTDKATNSTTKTFNLVWDTTAPTGTFTINNNPANPKYINSKNVTLNSNIADTNGSGVYQMSFSNDNSTWSAPEAYADTKDWILTNGDGEKTVYVKFTDNAGNTYEVNDKIIVDSTAPVITFTQDIQSTDPVQSQNIAIHLDEANTASANYIFSADTSCETKDYAQSQTFTSDQVITINSEANNNKYICAKVTDKSDNTSYKASINPLNIDVTAPSLSFASDVQAGPVQSNDINITAIETNPNTYKYGFTQNNCDSFNNTFVPGTTFTINDESHNTNYICAQAIDKAGNTTYIKSLKTLNIDVTKPVVSFTDDVQQNPTQSDTVQINVNEINPNKYGYVFADDNSCNTKDYTNQTIFTSDQTITFNSEANNNKYICVKAEDKAGNVTYLASQNKLNIDVTAPQIFFADDVDQGPTQVDTININSTEANPDTYKYGFTSNTCDQTVSFGNNFTPSQVITIDKDFIRDTQNGNYICAQAIDQAGNTSYKKSANKLNIDIVAPKLQKIDSSTPDVTIDNAYGTGQPISVCAYYDEQLKDSSKVTVTMDLVADVKFDLNQLDQTKHVLCGSFNVDGPRKGYDTTPNHLNVKSLSNENVVDIADNVQKYSDLQVLNDNHQNLADNRSIIIDTGGPILQSFTASPSSADLNSGKPITITANYSKPVVAGSSIKVKLNTKDGGSDEITLDQRNSNKLSGTYTVQEGDNVSNLKISEITSQNVHDAKGNAVLILTGTFDSYNSQVDTYNNQPNQTDHIDHVENITDGIRIDTQAPTNSSLVVNDGAQETKPNTVNLELVTEDNFPDLAGMKIQISNNGSTWCDSNSTLNAKSDYTQEIQGWNIMNSACGNQADPDPVTDNVAAKVYIKFIDGAGNENIAQDDIIFNGVPPRVIEVSSAADPSILYGPGMQIPISLKYNKALNPTKTSQASVYFNNNGFATLSKTSDDTMSGVYTVSVSNPKEDTNNLSISSLSQNVFDTAENEQTASTLPSKATNNLASGIHIDTTAPVGQLNIDRSVGDGNMKVTFSALDDNGTQGMKAKFKVLDDQSASCSFTNQPEIDVTGENMNVTISSQDPSYTYNDNNDPKKVCLQLIDRAGNASSPSAIFANAVTPETPQNLAVTDNSNVSANFFGSFVTWKIPADNGEGTGGWKSYEILHCKVDKSAADCIPNDFSDTYRDVITDTSDTNYISFNGLSEGSKYCYRVRFRDKNGDTGDYSKFSETQCIVPGENIQVSTAKIDVRNGDGDISIYDVTKSGATVTFRTQDIQKDSIAFPTIANIDVYAAYSNVDKDGNPIADPENKENWLQDKVGTFTDSGTISSPNPQAKHTIKLKDLVSGKQYYLKISAVDPQYFGTEQQANHTKVVSYDGEKGSNSNLTFTTLGALSKIYNISDPPTILSDKDVVIDFRTDQNANCLVEYGTSSVAQQSQAAQILKDNQAAADATCKDKTSGTQCLIGTASGSCDGSGKCVALSPISSAPATYNEIPASETSGEFTTNHSLHLASLLPQTVYYYKLTCSDGAAEKPAIISSAEGKFRTLDRQMTEADFAGRVDGTAPTISNVSLANLTGESATITWTTNEPSNSSVAYETEGALFTRMESDYKINSNPQNYTTTHTITLNNLIPDTKYSFAPLSMDAAGNVAQPTFTTFTTKQPSSLSSIKVVSAALGQATITWTTGSPATSEIEYGLTTAYGQNKQDSSKTKDHTIVLEGLTPGQTYHFRVLGKDDQNNIFASSDITFQPKAPPKIDNFKVDSITEHGAIVSFATNVPTDSLVTYTDQANKDNSGFQGKPEVATKHEIELKNLASGVEYSLKIKVRDEDGNETEEVFPNFTTSVDEKPPVIDRIKTDSALTQNDKVQAIISWTTDELATGQVIYKEGKTGEEKTFDVNTSPSFSHVGVITTFKPGTVYYFNVKSTDAAGNVSKSTDYALLTPKQSQNIIQIIIGNFTDIFGWANFSK